MLQAVLETIPEEEEEDDGGRDFDYWYIALAVFALGGILFFAAYKWAAASQVRGSRFRVRLVVVVVLCVSCLLASSLVLVIFLVLIIAAAALLWIVLRVFGVIKSFGFARVERCVILVCFLAALEGARDGNIGELQYRQHEATGAADVADAAGGGC